MKKEKRRLENKEIKNLHKVTYSFYSNALQMYGN